MQQSKIIRTMKTLSKTELSRLKQFVESPYFNKHPQVIRLMEIVYDYHPDFESPALERERVFKQLFPGETFDYNKLAHVMNYLQDVTEQFFSIEALSADDLLNNYLLLNKLKSTGNHKLYEKKLLLTQKKLKKTHSPDKRLFYYKMLFEDELDSFYINRKKKMDTNHLQQKSDNLDFFFIVNKLEYWCDMLNRSNVLNIEYETPLMDEVLQLIADNAEKYLSIPSIKVYYHVLLTLKEPEQAEHYFNLKTYLMSTQKGLHEKDIKSMFDYAQNYCIKRINKGDSDFLGELLELYREMVKRELIYENGYFPPSDFKNIITISCRTKEFSWAEQFIHRYKEKLEPSVREHVYQYNLASLYYEKGDYDSALELLNRVEFTDIYFALGGRSMLMKIYFERNDSDALNWHLDAFTNYIRRNKLVSKYQFKVHNNFIKFTRKAYALKHATDWKSHSEVKKETKTLLEKINQTKEITNRVWLEKQLEEIVKADTNILQNK